MLLFILNKTLAVLVIGSHGVLFLLLGYLWLSYKYQKKNFILEYIVKNGIPVAFLIAAASTVFSLLYSNVIGFAPCTLCWYQRIFMYPLVVLLGMAWLKHNDTHILDYTLALSILGGIIALYHNYIYYGGASLFPCDASGLGVSCNRQYVLELGYITIPLMSATAFALVFVLLLAQKKYSSYKQ